MSMERLLWESDATALAAGVRTGEIDARELVDAAIARAERVNPKINAIAERIYERARRDAATVDRSLPFAGVPIAIKDLGVSMEGVPVHSGSRLPPIIGERDSTIIARYRAAGFIAIATSTTPEFGLRLVTESERFGITRNPWNTGHVTGGSSGGAAALVAAGVVPVAHASDGGGSIRVPSACCGLVGLKPSRGRVPLTPDIAEGWYGLAVQHSVTRSVRDSAAMLDLSSAHDPLSPYQAPAPSGRFADAAARMPKKLRIGLFRRSPLDLSVSEDSNKAFDTAAGLCRDAGHRVEEIDLPMLNRAFIADFARVVASAQAGALRLESERIGRSAMHGVERLARMMARLGEMYSAGEISAALMRLQAASIEMLQITNRFDAVLMPLIAHPPVVCGGLEPTGADLLAEKALDRLRLTRLMRIGPLLDKMLDSSLWFTHWPAIQNVSGQPAIALPVHVTGQGLPLGVQFVGRIGDEETLLSLAGQFEPMSGWLTRRAPLEIPD